MASGLKYFLSDKPVVPKFQTVDIGEETAESIAENKANLPALAQFAEEFNKLSADQMMAQLERMLPGYGALLSKGTSNIQSLLRGEVPEDVRNQLERQAAERGVTLGTGGSDFSDNQFLRNFGLTSLNLTQQGLDSAMQWMNQAQSRTPIFNMGSAFLPISQRVNLRAQENQFKFQRDWLANQIKAVPWGVEGWAINLADRIESIGYQVVSSYAGMATGGGGMGGGGGASSGASAGATGYGTTAEHFGNIRSAY